VPLAQSAQLPLPVSCAYVPAAQAAQADDAAEPVAARKKPALQPVQAALPAAAPY
jgi:hypothetical protein